MSNAFKADCGGRASIAHICLCWDALRLGDALINVVTLLDASTLTVLGASTL